jgi:hypothetical protein
MMVVMVVVVMVIPTMVMMVMIPAMVVVVVVMVLILRELHVWVLPGLRFVARHGEGIGIHQQSDRIRDWLEQLGIRPGGQHVRNILCPRYFHRAYSYKGGNCAHKASGLLIHVHLRERTHARACPEKVARLFRDMLQLFEFKRFLFDHVIPRDREAL